MNVSLVHSTPWQHCSRAIRTCWDSHHKSDNGGDKDFELIYRVGKKYKHESVLEHIQFSFYIEGISRACLQELARHRMSSLSVKSTRYTLKELSREPLYTESEEDFKRAEDYLVITGIYDVDKASIGALNNVISLLQRGYPIDKVKYSLPEAYKTNLYWTINLRSLNNFLTLRSSPNALWEIRELCNNIRNSVPGDFEDLLEGV